MRHNEEMIDKITSVLNKVGTVITADPFATPLRIQRDLLFGPEVWAPELERAVGHSLVPKLPPIDWSTAMGLDPAPPQFASRPTCKHHVQVGVNFLDKFRLGVGSPQTSTGK